MNYFEYMASYIKSGGASFGGGGGGTKLLKYQGTGEALPTNPVMDGMFNNSYGFIKVWDTVPSAEELIGGVLATTKTQGGTIPLTSDFFIDLSPMMGMDMPAFCWFPDNFDGDFENVVNTNVFLLVVSESDDEVDSGVYVAENLVPVDTNEFIYLACNSGGASSGGGSSSGGSDSKTGAAYYDVTYNTIGAELGLCLASRETPDIRNGATGYVINDGATGGIFDQIETSKGSTINFTAAHEEGTDIVALLDDNEYPLYAIALRDTTEGDVVLEKGVYCFPSEGAEFDTISFYLCWTNP